MSWATDHTVTVTIDGVDMTQYLIASSLYIRANIGNDADIASFELRDANLSLNPYGWDEVTISIDSVDVFGGYIVERSATAVDATSGTHWIIECKDWSLLFDTIQVDERYSQYESGGTQYAWSDKQIIADLFSTYLSGEGFDVATNVTQQNATANIAFENVSLREALNQLAARMYADWFVAPDKALYWFNPASPGNAAFSIDSESPDYSASYPPLRNSVRRSVDELNIINDVTVIGGYTEARETHTFTFAASVWDYQLPYKVKSVVQVRLETTGGYVPLTNASNRLVYAPDGLLDSEGGEGWVRVDLSNSQVTISSTFTAANMTAGDTIEVDYFYLSPVTATATSAASIASYGRTIKRTYYDENLLTTGAAQEYADAIISEYAFGKETIRFNVAEYGLLAGRLLSVKVPAIDVGGDILLLQEDTDLILAENNDNLATEATLAARTYLIQQVEYRPVPAAGGTYLMIASVQCGAYQNTLIEALQRLSGASGALSAGPGTLPAVRYPGSLSNIANGLGEIVAGRLTLTNGGTAPFSWSAFNAHTGVVVGLDDSGTVGVGNFLLLQHGTAKVRIGRLDGLGTVNGMALSGYGIYTDNGFFKGTVAASLVSGGTVSGGLVTGGTVSGNTISGGTITGSRISGGTVSGALVSAGTVSGARITGGTAIITAGSIGGYTIQNNLLYANGGTIQTGSVVNSSNPGVRMDSSGLFGYGTTGLTFALYSDPALRPVFSSGTILNTVYEVTTASVLRTGTANPRVQIDNSGIFAYNSGGTLTTSIDVATGRLTAINGSFSGTVSASTITGGTVSGGYISGGTVSGALVTTSDSQTQLDDDGLTISTGTDVTNAVNFVNGTARIGYLTAHTDGVWGGLSTYLVSAEQGGTAGRMRFEAYGTGAAVTRIRLDPSGDYFTGEATDAAHISILPTQDAGVGSVTIYGNRARIVGDLSVGGNVSMSGTLQPTTADSLTIRGATYLYGSVFLDPGSARFANSILFNQDGYDIGSSSAGLSRVYFKDTAGTARYKIEINNGTVLVTSA